MWGKGKEEKEEETEKETEKEVVKEMGVLVQYLLAEGLLHRLVKAGLGLDPLAEHGVPGLAVLLLLLLPPLLPLLLRPQPWLGGGQ